MVDGEVKKPPFNPRTGMMASVANPTTWSSFQEAKTAYQRRNYAGVGFMLTQETGIVGIDIDHCFRDGKYSDQAHEIMTQLNTYTERSPSGEGLRLFLHGSLPGPYRRRGTIELYEDRRYLTVTGHMLPGAPRTLEYREAELNALYQQLFPATRQAVSKENTGGGVVEIPVPRRDEQVLEKAYAAKNGQLFRRYYEGDSSLWEGTGAKHHSQSEADFTLCLMLLYWTNNDINQVDRLFRKSGLMRQKWEGKTGGLRYGERTIREALRKRRP